MLLAHKVELRPTPEQATWLLKCIGARRYTYNALLEHFRKDGVKWSKHVALTSMLRRLKKVISDSGLSGFCATFHFGGHPYPLPWIAPPGFPECRGCPGLHRNRDFSRVSERAEEPVMERGSRRFGQVSDRLTAT